MSSLIQCRLPWQDQVEELRFDCVAKVQALAPTAASLSFGQKLIAGAAARGVAQTVLHPIDVMRTRLQAKNITSPLTAQTLLKGVIPQITLAVPAGALQFTAFEFCKEKLAEIMPGEKLQSARDLIAGAGGALAASIVRVPQEVLKQRIQADVYPNVFKAVPMLLSEKGPMGLFTGYFATISRDVPWNALSFLFHAQSKRLFASIKDRAPTNDENLLLASAAGSLAAIIMTPVDVVKTRLMTQRAGEEVYKGIFNTFGKIVAEEGFPTLFKGLIPRILFLAPLAGITLSVYEGIVKVMLKDMQEAQKVTMGSGAKSAPMRVAMGAGASPSSSSTQSLCLPKARTNFQPLAFSLTSTVRGTRSRTRR